MKATTCEEYVLQEMEAAKRRVDILEDEVDRLNRKLYGAVNKAATDAIFDECFKPLEKKGIPFGVWSGLSVDVPEKYDFVESDFVDFFRAELSREYRKISEEQ